MNNSSSHQIIYSIVVVSASVASLPGNPPLPVTMHVNQCNNRPGGPMRLHSSTECEVNTPPRRSPSSHIQRPTNRSQVNTWLHSSDTKFGYYFPPSCIMPPQNTCISILFEYYVKIILAIWIYFCFCFIQHSPASCQPWPSEDHHLGRIHSQIQPLVQYHLAEQWRIRLWRNARGNIWWLSLW